MSIITPEAEDAAAIIRNTPALLNEARGWIGDAYPIGDGAPDILTPEAVTRVLQRGYAGGCAEFVRNSAPLIPAPAPVDEHYANYTRYLEVWQAKQQPFTASQQDTPPQYLPYARYPHTPATS